MNNETKLIELGLAWRKEVGVAHLGSEVGISPAATALLNELEKYYREAINEVKE